MPLTDTSSVETQEKYKDSPLWKSWMGHTVDLIQLDSMDRVRSIIDMGRGQHIAWDVETSSLDAHKDNVVGHCIAIDDRQGYYIPVNHLSSHASINLDPDEVWDCLLEAFNEPSTEIFVYNYKFEGQILRSVNQYIPAVIDNKIKVHDVFIYRWLYHSEDLKLDLKSSVQKYLNYEMIEINEVPQVFEKVGKNKKILNFGNTDPEDATLYAAADPVFTYKWYKKIAKDNPEKLFEPGQPNTLYDVLLLEHNLLDSLFFMENPIEGTKPVHIDRSFLQLAEENMNNWINLLTAKIWEKVGIFNIASNVQLGNMFLHMLDFKLQKNEKGNYQTDESVLQELKSFAKDEEKREEMKEVSQMADWILTFRHLTKQQSTYIRKLLKYTEDEPYARFVFRSTGARTGRFSSGGVQKEDRWYTPFNAQNVPRAGRFSIAPAREILNPSHLGGQHVAEQPTLVDEFNKLSERAIESKKTRISFELEDQV